MGLFDGLKRVFNIGGAELHVFTEFDSYHQGEDIHGEVEVIGGNIEQDASALTLSLVEFWTERRTSGHGKNRTTRTVTVTRIWQTDTLAAPCPIGPGQQARFPFAVSLPDGARLSTRSTGWRFDVGLDVPGGLDPSNIVRIDVLPAMEILRVGQVIEQRLRFVEDLRHRRWYKSSGRCHLRFQPPAALRDHLDHLELELARQADASVGGTLRFDLQERGFTDYLKAIVNCDGKTYSITIEPELVDEDFTPEDEAEIARQIGDIMQEVLRERGG